MFFRVSNERIRSCEAISRLPATSPNVAFGSKAVKAQGSPRLAGGRDHCVGAIAISVVQGTEEFVNVAVHLGNH